jgi:hypothetical protein
MISGHVREWNVSCSERLWCIPWVVNTTSSAMVQDGGGRSLLLAAVDEIHSIHLVPQDFFGLRTDASSPNKRPLHTTHPAQNTMIHSNSTTTTHIFFSPTIANLSLQRHDTTIFRILIPWHRVRRRRMTQMSPRLPINERMIPKVLGAFRDRSCNHCTDVWMVFKECWPWTFCRSE